MKKIRKKPIIFGTIFVLFVVISVIFLFFMNKTNYQKVVSEFRKISVSDVQKIRETDDKALIYVGKESCPACVEFAPKLLQAKKNVDVTIYYLDSTDSKTDKAFIDFKLEYNVTSVPTLLFFEEGTVSTPSVEAEGDSLTNTLKVLFDKKK